jgi:hypothetical protein
VPLNKIFACDTVAFPVYAMRQSPGIIRDQGSLMKTDDYKQELRLSATLCQTNAKKYFGRSKKST